MSNIKKYFTQPKPLNQSGIASILATLIMSVVITLIVLGFAQISTREQTNALQSQLSTTAFYAAETGINDAITVIKNNPNLSAAQYDKSSCSAPASQNIYSSLYNANNGTTTFSNPTDSSNPSLGAPTYSCLLVNPNPATIVTGVDANSTVIPINSNTGTMAPIITSIQLKWSSAAGWTECGQYSTPFKFVPNSGAANSWTCSLSVLRIDLVPITTAMNSNNLLQSTMSAFLVPYNNGSGAVTFVNNSSNTNTPVYGGNCSTASSGCTVNINFPATVSHSEYYLRVSTIYGGSNTLTISAYNNATSLPLSGVEYLIDSTGRDQGVLRRIQVALPILQSTDVPGYAIQTTNDICKSFYIIPSDAPGDEYSLNPSAAASNSSVLDCSLNGY